MKLTGDAPTRPSMLERCIEACGWPMLGGYDAWKQVSCEPCSASLVCTPRTLARDQWWRRWGGAVFTPGRASGSSPPPSYAEALNLQNVVGQQANQNKTVLRGVDTLRPLAPACLQAGPRVARLLSESALRPSPSPFCDPLLHVRHWQHSGGSMNIFPPNGRTRHTQPRAVIEHEK